VVQATLGMAGAIIGEAALSFLGLGVQPPTPSWGTMLNGGRAHLLDAPHLTMFPGLAIALLVLGFNFGVSLILQCNQEIVLTARKIFLTGYDLLRQKEEVCCHR
jgi:ABC-type antimicrobial peptide transport system permease subunit